MEKQDCGCRRLGWSKSPPNAIVRSWPRLCENVGQFRIGGSCDHSASQKNRLQRDLSAQHLCAHIIVVFSHGLGRSATERVTVEGRPVRPFDLYPKPQLDAWGRKEIVCGG